MKPADLKRLIRESNLIEGISDPLEIEQSLVAWNYLYDHNMPLTHGVICKVQKIITLRQKDLVGPQRGYYRSMTETNVRVGNYVPPHYDMVEGLMGNWLLDYDKLGPWEAHRRFETIHPFVDGNGRTGRMLMWWQELKAGGEPTLIWAKDRQDYYRRLSGGRNVAA